MDPVDWRPREFNTAADYVANCVLHHKRDFNKITEHTAAEILQDAIGLQVYSDGGFNFGIGAAAFVVTCVKWDGERLQSVMMGSRGILIEGARSAFHTEVTALDMAVRFVLDLVRRL